MDLMIILLIVDRVNGHLPMTFLHPLILGAGLACVALPIIIHFFMRRRRKPVEWAAMRFLLEAYQQQRRRLQFEQWLLLAARCLVVALIAMGLAVPLVGGGLAGNTLGGAKPRELFILIDTGLASAARDADGTTALERHKQAAAAALAALDPARGDRAALITLGGPADPVVLPPATEPGAVGEIIDALEPTESRTDIAGALSMVAETIGEDDADADRIVLVLTDWRAGSIDADTELPRLPDSVRVVASSPATDPIDNQQITSVRPLRAVVLAGESGASDTAGSAQQVRVELRRLGPSLAESSAALILRLDRVSAAGRPEPDRAARTETPFTWAPGQTEITLVAPLPSIDNPSPGLGVLTAELRAGPGQDAIPGDGTVRRVVDVRRGLRVGVVARGRFGGRAGIASFEPADWVLAALDPTGRSSTAIEPVPIEPSAVDTPRLAGLDALFILEPGAVDTRAWARLAPFIARGGLVVIAPDAEPGAAAWTAPAVEALALPIDIDPEPTDHADPLAITSTPDLDLGPLSLLAAELQSLTGPVRVYRTLDVRPAPNASAGAVRTLLRLSNDRPLVAVTTSTAGADGPTTGMVAFITAAVDPDWTDLPARPLFVPLVQELVRQGVGEARGSASVIAGSRPTAPPGSAELAAIDTPRRVALTPAGVAASPVRTSGAFAALDAEGAMRALAITNPDADAGRVATTDLGAAAEYLGSTGRPLTWIESDETSGPTAGPPITPGDVARALATNTEEGSPVAWIALLAALVLALAEMGLARRASHAERRTDTSGSPAARPRAGGASPAREAAA
jgi:hypothetical protein